jgi:hypothetical protein
MQRLYFKPNISLVYEAVIYSWQYKDFPNLKIKSHTICD